MLAAGGLIGLGIVAGVAFVVVQARAHRLDRFKIHINRSANGMSVTTGPHVRASMPPPQADPEPAPDTPAVEDRHKHLFEIPPHVADNPPPQTASVAPDPGETVAEGTTPKIAGHPSEGASGDGTSGGAKDDDGTVVEFFGLEAHESDFKDKKK